MLLWDAIIRRYLLIYLLIYLIGLDLSANLSSYFRDVRILYNQYYVYNQYYMYVVTCMSTTIFLHWVHCTGTTYWYNCTVLPVPGTTTAAAVAAATTTAAVAAAAAAATTSG